MEFIAALQPKYSGVSVVVFFKSCTGVSLSILDISRNACIMIGLKEAVCLAVVFFAAIRLTQHVQWIHGGVFRSFRMRDRFCLVRNRLQWGSYNFGRWVLRFRLSFMLSGGRFEDVLRPRSAAASTITGPFGFRLFPAMRYRGRTQQLTTRGLRIGIQSTKYL